MRVTEQLTSVADGSHARRADAATLARLVIAMLPEIPPLPENTAFKLDQDEYGQPRLRWGGPSLGQRWFQIVATANALFAVFALPCLCMGILGEWISFGTTWLIGGWFCGSFIWILFGLIMSYAVWQYTQPGGECSILLTEAWLLHWPPDRQPMQWGRWQLRQAHLKQGLDRQRLVLDDGDYQIEIGQSLSSTDRQWLAEVIREWIVPPRLTQLSPESEGPAATPG